MCFLIMTLTDKIPPEVVSCPRDVHVFSEERLTQVSWTEPEFSGFVGTPNAVFANSELCTVTSRYVLI